MLWKCLANVVWLLGMEWGMRQLASKSVRVSIPITLLVMLDVLDLVYFSGSLSCKRAGSIVRFVRKMWP